MSSKVVEADAGIHSLAMAVAVRFSPDCRYALIYMSSFFWCLRLNPACHQLALIWYGISFVVLTQTFCISRASQHQADL
jgi:hypothetical protein